MKAACYALTGKGARLARRIALDLDGDFFAPLRLDLPDARGFSSLPDLVKRTFRLYQTHVFIGAAGIAVRCIAPHLRHKSRDPAVLVCDRRGGHVISLLSGHLGGANALARKVAALVGGRAVITTASDAEGLPALDVLAREAGCATADPFEMKSMQTALLEGERIRLIDPLHCLPIEHEAFVRLADPEDVPEDAFHVIAGWRGIPAAPKRLRLTVPVLYAGIGCRKNISAGAVLEAIEAALREAGAEMPALAGLASISLKEREAGLLEAARRLRLPLRFFDARALADIPVPNPSRKAGEILGSPPIGVCEGAALAAAGLPEAELLLPKRARAGVTVALALGRPVSRSAPVPETPPREKTPAPLRIVGIGPGDAAGMTARAEAALEASRLVAGYSLYVDMLPPELLRGRERVTTGMRRETDRCKAAVDAALAGIPTALVCSGDAGVYGMAGLVFELLEQRDPAHRIPVEVVPGVPALCSAAALLGAPLMHDFACVSLSDLLTPWELIVRRVEAALRADFVLVLYNPRSKGRSGHLAVILELIRKTRPAHTPVGLVRQAYRPGQETSAGSLGDFDPTRADMLSIVFVGNSSTRLIGNRMVTPRGYFGGPVKTPGSG
jgi:cobalt-precorrin 5A hydrolase/precorrin-3B C17-methyltransferase